jgi:AAA family ATP:ADP antiporter
MSSEQAAAASAHPSPRALRLLGKLVQIRPEEVRPLIWCWLYIFCVLSAYYVIRPIRDTMGIAGGVRNLSWLFSATLVCMLLSNLPFAALSRRLPRARFIAIAYRFFIANLLLFALLLGWATQTQAVWIGRVFFVWVSVFNLFVVSVFWTLIVDIFNGEQGKRLFALMAAGATIGAIVGSSVTAMLARTVAPMWLLAISACLLEVAVLCVRRLSRLHTPRVSGQPNPGSEAGTIGGTVLAGIAHTFRSPYLLNICAYILLFSITSTTLYFQQAEVVHHTFGNDRSRETFFAMLDLTVNVLTLLTQVLLTGRIVRRLGVALTLTIIPALSAAGFAVLAMSPTIAVLVVFAVLRRAGNFAIARPTREILFTVLSREDKYKAKSFIDTVVYRAGDQVGAWVYAGGAAIGLSGGAAALVAVPLSLLWLANSFWLGRRRERMAKRNAALDDSHGQHAESTSRSARHS